MVYGSTADVVLSAGVVCYKGSFPCFLVAVIFFNKVLDSFSGIAQGRFEVFFGHGGKGARIKAHQTMICCGILIDADCFKVEATGFPVREGEDEVYWGFEEQC